MKLAEASPYANPKAAARNLVELAIDVAPVQGGRVRVEKVNAPFLFALKAKGSGFGSGLIYRRTRLVRTARKRHPCADTGARRRSVSRTVKPAFRRSTTNLRLNNLEPPAPHAA